jgi:chromosome segregation ATPase
MSVSPHRNKQWGEHWPDRPDDGIREKLRALFQPTDDLDLEALIAERGQELEARTAQLAATIADLEQREERARQLRVTVEEMLRHGAAELDEREAQLNEVARRLADREAALRELEQELANRRQELGAVELHRAAVERRETALTERERAHESDATDLSARERQIAEAEGRSRRVLARERELATRENKAAAREQALETAEDAATRRAEELSLAAARLAAREATLARAQPAPTSAGPTEEPERERSHVLFVARERYRLMEVDGPAPPLDAEVEVEGTRYRVFRHGSSPLPGDTRRCAVLEPLPPTDDAAATL